MRVKKRNFICLTLLVVLLTACGKEADKTVADKPVVKTVSLESMEQTTTYPFANTKYFYRPLEREPGFVQYSKTDINKKSEFAIPDFMSLVAVTEERIYYTKMVMEGVSELWEMPIDVEHVGARKVLEEAGEIVGEATAYADERYILYVTDRGDVVKYEIETGRKVRRRQEKENNFTWIDMVEGNDAIVASMYDGMWHWDLETDEWERISKEVYYDSLHRVQVGSQLYYAKGDKKDNCEEIRVYDVRTREKECAISHKQLKKACKELVKEQKGTFEKYFVDRLFSMGDKIYIQVQVDWKTEKIYRMQYMIFSANIKGEMELQPEAGLMWCIRNNSDETATTYMKNQDMEIWDCGHCICIVDGKAIVVLNTMDERPCEVGCYNLKTGSFRRLTRRDADYYLPYYMQENTFEYDFLNEITMSYLPKNMELYWEC